MVFDTDSHFKKRKKRVFLILKKRKIGILKLGLLLALGSSRVGW